MFNRTWMTHIIKDKLCLCYWKCSVKVTLVNPTLLASNQICWPAKSRSLQTSSNCRICHQVWSKTHRNLWPLTLPLTLNWNSQWRLISLLEFINLKDRIKSNSSRSASPNSHRAIRLRQLKVDKLFKKMTRIFWIRMTVNYHLVKILSISVK